MFRFDDRRFQHLLDNMYDRRQISKVLPSNVSAACSSGNLALLKQLITKHNVSLEARTPLQGELQGGDTLFHLSCSSPNCPLSILQCLVTSDKEKEVSFSQLRNSNKSLPLHLACASGKKDFVNFLFPKYNSCDDFLVPNDLGHTPLYLAACTSFSHDIVALICTNVPNIPPDIIYQCISNIIVTAQATNNDNNVAIIKTLLQSITFDNFLNRLCQDDNYQSYAYIVQSEIEWKDLKGIPLHQAAILGNTNYVTFLSSKMGCEINSLDDEFCTPLHRAILNGQEEVSLYLLSLSNCNSQTKNQQGRYPLHDAVELNQFETVKSLIVNDKCDFNIQEDVKQFTPLHIACYKGHESIVELLASNPECLVEALDSNNKIPLYYAVSEEHTDIITYLADKISKDCLYGFIKLAGSDKVPISIINILLDRYGNSSMYAYRVFQDDHDILGPVNFSLNTWSAYDALHPAVTANNLTYVKYMLDSGVFDINSTRSCDKNTPLHCACKMGHFEMVKFLANHPQCTSLEIPNDQGMTPLHYACQAAVWTYSSNSQDETQYIDIVRFLVLDKGCNINVKNTFGSTPFHLAACVAARSESKVKIVKFLTSQPQSSEFIDSPDNNGLTPLAYAFPFHFGDDNLEIIEYLVDKGCDVTVHDSRKNTLLHVACRMKYYQLIKTLVNNPVVDVDAKNDFGQTPAHVACTIDDNDVINNLISCDRININDKDNQGNTPLHLACYRKNLDVVKSIADHPQCDSLNVGNDKEEKPIHCACVSSSYDIVHYLVVDKKCSINDQRKDGETPFSLACGHLNSNIACFLLDQPDCDSYEVDNNLGYRPIHKVCQNRNIEIAKKLVIEKKCDINIAIPHDGSTPMHMACLSGSFEMFKLLADQPRCNTFEEVNIRREAPIHVACRGRNEDIIRYLIDKKQCSLHNYTSRKETPITLAYTNHCTPEIISFLMSKLKKIDLLNLLQSSPYLSAFINYHRALETNGMTAMKYGKLIVIGPPNSGKTILLKRLLNKRKTFTDCTGLMTSHVCSYITSPTCTTDSTIQWSLTDYKDEASLMLASIANGKSKKRINSKNQKRILKLKGRVGKGKGRYQRKGIVIKKERGKEKKVKREVKQGKGEEKKQKGKRMAAMKSIFSKRKPTKINPTIEEIDKGLKALFSIMDDNYRLHRTIHKKEKEDFNHGNDHIMLQVIDTGSLPLNNELLPFLIPGPFINLSIFDLTHDLSSPVQTTTTTSTACSLQETIFNSLASINSSRPSAYNLPFSQVIDKSISSSLIVGTHSDCITTQQLTLINKQLKKQLENANDSIMDSLWYPLDSSNDKVLFDVNLTKLKNNEEIDDLRSSIHHMLTTGLSQLLIPSSWCTFIINIKKIKRSFTAYKTCYRIAQECGITTHEDMQSALWFMHHKLGTIMYFPAVKELHKTVITNPQLVYNYISQIISRGNENGIVTYSDLHVLFHSSKGPFTVTKIISLLQHLNIIAEYSSNQYFTPFSLSLTDLQQPAHQTYTIAPLHVTFKCGYTPLGLLCGVIIHLFKNCNWKLKDKGCRYRNKIDFEVDNDIITIISHSCHLEVLCTGPSNSNQLIQHKATLHSAITTVLQSLHYQYDIVKHSFGFHCSFCGRSSNIDNDKMTALCIYCDNVMKLEEKHLVWLQKDMTLDVLKKKGSKLKRKSIQPSANKKRKTDDSKEEKKRSQPGKRSGHSYKRKKGVTSVQVKIKRIKRQ